MGRSTKKLICILLFLPPLALSHGGKLDKIGGHFNKKNGDYHCHRETCFNRHRVAEEAMELASRKGRAFSYLYNRDDWKHWSDFDNDCMNTRHETLKLQAIGQVKLSKNGCQVTTGVWLDPYGGKKLTKASDLDVDHIIPLKWANDHGGGAWPPSKKEKFANDPINLEAVDDGLNQAKGAKGPDEWMPPNPNFRCVYLLQWRNVLSQYPTLKFTPSEKRAFDELMTDCPS